MFKNILIVDDDAMSRGLLRLVLELDGWHCVDADTGPRGLSLLGLLNISKFSPFHNTMRGQDASLKNWGVFKKGVQSCPEASRREGRSYLDERSVRRNT